MLITGPWDFQKQVGPPILCSILNWEENQEGPTKSQISGLSVREVLVSDPRLQDYSSIFSTHTHTHTHTHTI